MQYAIIGTTCFTFGVLLGLWCQMKYNNDKAYKEGYDNGFNDAAIAVEYIENKILLKGN